MYHLVYVSSAVKPFTEQELIGLLAVSRKNNERDGITGMLLYRDGNFMQHLEGPKENVVSSMRRISLDPRHRGIIALLQGETKERTFSEWAMGFKTLSAETAKEHPGFSDFLETPLNSEEFQVQPSRSLKLLQTFKEKMR